MRLKWIIQDTLLAEDNLKKLIDAIDELGWERQCVGMIPFSHEITGDLKPEPDCVYIGYGSTTFIQTLDCATYHPGIFFNRKTFDFRAWATHIPHLLVNGDARISTLGQLNYIWQYHPLDLPHEIFIRPCRDLKDFSGQLIVCDEFNDWFQRMSAGDGYLFGLDLDIVVAKPKILLREWRCVVVDDKIAGISLYRQDGRLVKSLDVEPHVRERAAELAKEWGPDKVYVMDLAEMSNGEIKILEFNCFHGSGFYGDNQKEVVEAVSNFVFENYAAEVWY